MADQTTVATSKIVSSFIATPMTMVTPPVTSSTMQVTATVPSVSTPLQMP